MTRLRILLFIVIGLAVGIGAGLTIGWVVWPTEFTDANPSVLQAAYRRDYVQMIADTYALDNDLAAAQSRLRDVEEDETAVLLDALTDKVLANADEAEIRRLVQLAIDLDISSPVMTPFLPEADS
ncbi:MAG: hypothetical protein KC419_26305 [Anaerolineales bacterium]|nr:hypothetical protein [Anaerolineales bacterium]